MVVKILRSRWFWIFLIICIVEEATFFFPFLSIFPLAAGISYPLCAGLNMVAVPLYSTSLVNASDLLAAIPNATGVWRWKGEVNCLNVGFDGFFPISLPAEDFLLMPGRSYWVSVTLAGNWAPPNP